MNVRLDGDPIAVGTAYTLVDADGTETSQTVSTAGVISLKGGQTAIIPGIMSGTTFEVWEDDSHAEDYSVTYGISGNNVDASSMSGKASGTLYATAKVTVTVTNTPLHVGSLRITKTVVPSTDTTGFTFTVTLAPPEGTTLPSSFTVHFMNQTGEETTGTATLDENNRLVFEDVSHGESVVITGIPTGTQWTVEETGAEGYVTEVTTGETTADGATASGAIVPGETAVGYTNSKIYSMPAAGGAGTCLYTLGGALLIAAAGLSAYNKKRRKEVSGN